MKTVLIDAYLLVPITMKHPSTKNRVNFDEGTAIKIDVMTLLAYIGPYTVELYRGDYALVM